MATKSIPTIAEVKAIIEDELSKLNLGSDIDLSAIAESIIPAISASYNLGSSTNVTSSTGRVNGFKFIPGNGSSYYYSWIAIGYEY